MRYVFKIDNWEYDITKNTDGYGFTLTIFRNSKPVLKWSGYGIESSAESFAKKYIIENQFNIELD